MRHGLCSVLGLSLLLVALPARAQPAPPDPQVGLKVEMERTRAAMCAKADVDGDSYRPFVCDARCPCLDTEIVEGLFSCETLEPGHVVAEGRVTEVHSCISVDECVPFGRFGNFCNVSSDPPLKAR